MNALNVNIEVMRQLGYIAGDEDGMKKVLRAIKRIVAQRDDVEMTECQARSREQIVSDLDAALNEARLYKDGKIELKQAEDLLNEL